MLSELEMELREDAANEILDSTYQGSSIYLAAGVGLAQDALLPEEAVRGQDDDVEHRRQPRQERLRAANVFPFATVPQIVANLPWSPGQL